MRTNTKNNVTNTLLLICSYLGYVKNRKAFRIFILVTQISRFIMSIVALKYLSSKLFSEVCKKENRNNYQLIFIDMTHTLIMVSHGYIKMVMFMLVQIAIANYISARALAERLNRSELPDSDLDKQNTYLSKFDQAFYKLNPDKNV